jgi:large subunit ribosomal protein L24
MQKLLRRAALADAQAARRLARKKERFLRQKAKSAREQELHAKREESSYIKTARKVRREDWELGDLAPRRDVGSKKDTYATVSMGSMRGRELTLEERLKVNPEGGRYANIVAGDRVVILEGRDKGKIGQVESVDAKSQELVVEGLNLVSLIYAGYFH